MGLVVGGDGEPRDDLPTDTRTWNPAESATLSGVFHLLAGLNWTVRTEDGALWMLRADAENQLEALNPAEGQSVKVFYKKGRFGRATYVVSLLP
jgi:hypothetical protein